MSILRRAALTRSLLTTLLVAGGIVSATINAPSAYAQPAPPPAGCGAWYWVEASQRDGNNDASSGNDYGSTGLSPRYNYWTFAPGEYAAVVQVINVRPGYNPNVLLTPGSDLSDQTPLRFTVDVAGANNVRVQSQFTRYRIWFANCLPPTPTPTATPPPTWTPTGGGGGSGGSSGSGGGGSGGVGTGTPTPTPTVDPAAVTGTPVPGWCGYVPSHPCWVTWATAQSVRVEGTITASLDATSVAGLADAVATRVPGAAYAPTVTAIASALEQGPQPAGYSRAGGDISISAYDIEMIDVQMYQYDCIAIDVFDTSICLRYGYIRRLWLGPVEVPIAMVVRAALALAAVAFIVRR